MSIEIIQVGKPFPDLRYIRTEGGVIRPLDAGFDFLAVVADLTASEIKSFKAGQATVALYTEAAIPFWIFEAGSLSVDATTNVFKIAPENREAWLQAEYNLVRFILIEQRTGVVKGMRALGLKPEMVKAYQECCAEQQEKYQSSAEVQKKEQGIMQLLPTSVMIRAAKFKQTF